MMDDPGTIRMVILSRNTLAMCAWNLMIACVLPCLRAHLIEMIALFFKTLIAIGFGLIMVALL
jgi:hypothetical protein